MSISPQLDGASPSPHCRVISRRIDDFSGFSEIFARWNGQFHQMSRGKFEGAVHMANGQVVRLFQADTNQAILTRGMDSEFATFIPITLRNAATRWSGRRLPPGALIAKLPEAEYNNQTIPNTTIRGLLVPLRTIQADDSHPLWKVLRLEIVDMERTTTVAAGNGTIRTRSRRPARNRDPNPSDFW